MYSKLSLRNARRQAQDYLVYFVTMVLVAALLYAFNGLLFSQEIKDLSKKADNLPLIIVLSSIVIICIVGWLVSYTTGFMLSRRSRELGTYLLVGLQNSQIARLFFLENLVVGGVAMLLGLPLGNLIFQALRAILLTMYSAPYRLSLLFSLKAAGLTCAYFAAIYLFALLKSRKRIRNMKIYDLIYFERQNEEALLQKSRSRRGLFAVSCLLGITGSILLLTGQLWPCIIGAGCLIAFLYGFFISFSSAVPAFFDRHPWRKFQGQNLLVFRGLSAKLATMGIAMATISLLFTATLLTEGAGMVFSALFRSRTDLSFDLILATDNLARFDSYVNYIHENIPLAMSRQYDIYQGEDDLFTEYICENSDYYRFFDYDLLMRCSDYAALREMLGYPPVTMEAGSFLIHCMPYLEAPARRYEQALSLNGQLLTPGGVYTESFAQSLWEANGHQFILVVPDAACEKRPLSHRLFAAMTKEPVSEEQFEALYEIFEGRAVTNTQSLHTGNELNLLHSKADTKAEYAAFSAITLFPLFYLSLTLAMTAVTVLTIQQLCETERYRRQFSLLGKLGMDKKEMRQALLKQLAIYYTLPSIPPVMIAVPIVLHMGNATEPGALTGASSPPAILGLTLGLFFLIYFLYIILAYNSLRRNVLN